MHNFSSTEDTVIIVLNIKIKIVFFKIVVNEKEVRITYMDYGCNKINILFYTKHHEKYNILAMLSIVADDLLLSYRDKNIEQEFYHTLSAAFDITTQTNTTKLEFFSLVIFRSPHGTSINQTQHIKDKYFCLCSQDCHQLKKINAPSTINASHELELPRLF